jgi:hypothetical protein
MFGFGKKKEEETVKAAPVVKPSKDTEALLLLKLQVLEVEVKEQRGMIRQLLKLSTMLAEHKRYELLQAELHKLSNVLDKIR